MSHLALGTPSLTRMELWVVDYPTLRKKRMSAFCLGQMDDKAENVA